MFALVISILALVFFVVVTVLNLNNKADLSLIFVTLDGVPSIVLVLIGVILGLIVAVPVTINLSRAYSKRVLEKSIHIEAKRMKQEQKKSKSKTKLKNKEQAATEPKKSNINA